MEKKVKIILAILLFLCLLNMPYAYYKLVRFVAMISFVYLAFKANEKQNANQVLVYIALALLFQPIFKIALGRFLWNVVDVIVGLALILSITQESKKRAN